MMDIANISLGYMKFYGRLYNLVVIVLTILSKFNQTLKQIKEVAQMIERAIIKVSLEEIKENPELEQEMQYSLVRIWSDEHEAFWRPNGSGYTADGLRAGIWRFSDAFKKTNHCDPGKRIQFWVVV
jgi:hypothetical protein